MGYRTITDDLEDFVVIITPRDYSSDAIYVSGRNATIGTVTDLIDKVANGTFESIEIRKSE
jgi:hypothetical protein